jgi:hypothetical protein
VGGIVKLTPDEETKRRKCHSEKKSFRQWQPVTELAVSSTWTSWKEFLLGLTAFVNDEKFRSFA